MKTLFFLLVSLNAYAQPMILANPNEIINFIADVKTSPDKSFYAEEYILAEIKKTNEAQLKSEFEFAQYQYYLDNKLKAKGLLENFIQTYSDKLLSVDSTNLLTTAYLLRAEIEVEHPKQIYWIQKAFILNPEYQANRDELKVEIINKFLHIKTSSKFVEFKISNQFQGYNYLVINNKVFDLLSTSTISWPEGRVSYRLLSHHLKPVMGSTDSANLKNIAPEKIPLVTGNCADYLVSDSVDRGLNPALYFSSNCIAKTIGHEPLKTVADPIKKMDYMAGKTSSSTQKDSPVFWKNKWVWITLTAGMVLYHNQSQASPHQDNSIILPALRVNY